MLGASAISILHSLGVLALMSVGISMLQPSRLGASPVLWRTTLMGVVYGATIALVMVDPVILPPGATFDARGGPALLAGVYGGPVAAVVAAVIGSITRLWIGGAGAPGGVLAFALYASAGIAARWYLDRTGIRPGPLWLVGFALFGTALTLPSFFLFSDWNTGISILSRAWWMLLSCNIVGTLVLGTLLEHDWRRRHLEHELRRAEALSRAAAEAKTRFLASMSHEIRTPMNGVVGFVDLLRDTKLDVFQRRCTDQVRDAAKGLLRIIDDILDYAKIDSGCVTIEPQPTDVAALLEGCRDLLLPQAETKGIAYSLDLKRRPAGRIVIDPIRLRQVVLNLLGNAVKFTDSGSVEMRVDYAPAPGMQRGELTISIADTGIGMSDQDASQVFRPFVQGHHVGRGGTGLGLVISRMLVNAMGGELSLSSVHGSGTTVTVRIPVSEARDVADRAKQPRRRVDDRTPLRILVAEDVPLNAEMLQATLEQLGHTVRVAANGQEALDAVSVSALDVVLMDVQMPVMDGLEATRAIRRLPGPAAMVPIIALTAYASREDLKQCLDAGMNDFLTKPLEREKLREKLRLWGDGATLPAGDAGESGLPHAAVDDEPPVAGEKVDRVGELLYRLAEADRDDRNAVRLMAHNLAAAAGTVGFDSLADRARRLVTASVRSNAEALGALIEDVTDAGRRAVEGARQMPRSEGR